MAAQPHIALLRGINVGGHNRVAMAELRALLTDAGYGDVRTLLQSGNVVLTARRGGDGLERELEQLLEAAFGFAIRVVVRSRDELADVVARDPLGDVADQPKLYQVSFLGSELERAVARDLEAADLGPERLVVSGREIYVWHANGVQRSPAAKLLNEKRLGVTATARNWNTVTKLLELATV